jgi:hypothetical protein
MASTLAFDGRVQKRVVAILRLYPGDSNADQGLRFSVYFTRLADYFGVRNPNVRRVRSAFPPVEDLYDSRAKTDRSDGYFRSEEEILRVANVLADQRE